MIGMRHQRSNLTPQSTLLMLLLVSGMACQSPSPEAPPPSDATLEAEVPDLMVKGDVPGLQIAVLSAGEVGWSGAFGVREPGGGPVDRDTIFPAASLSKPVFGYLVMRLAERGVIDLDTPLHELLPYARLEHDARYHGITARRVMSHTAGLPNWGGSPLEMVRAPGERFGYSGEGFVYLQKTVEKLTGRPLPEVAREEVFEPLGMARTSFVWEKAFAGNAVVGTTRVGDAQRIPRSGEANAAASLLTTADDYARFLAAVLAGEGLAPGTVDRILSREVEVRRDEPSPTDGEVFWGLAWGLQAGDGGDAFWHWGDNGAFKCYTVVDRTTGDGLVYFTNSHDGLSIAPSLVSRVLPGDHPALRWAGYETWDAPQRVVRMSLERAFAEGGAEVGTERYRQLVDDAPDQVTEGLVNRLGYYLVRKKKFSEAVSAFRLNAEAYPESSNVYDSLGEGLLAAGEYEAAIASYRKAKELNPESGNPVRFIAWIGEAIEARKQPVRMSADDLARLAGEYGDGRVTFDDGVLSFESEWVGETLQLEPMTRDTFGVVGHEDVRVRFEMGADGEPARLVVMTASGRSQVSERRGGG